MSPASPFSTAALEKRPLFRLPFLTLFLALLFLPLSCFAQETGNSDSDLEAWLDPAYLAANLDQVGESIILVDVRTAAEFAAGHIPGAVNIPVQVIQTQAPSPDMEKPIVVYCRSGSRSRQAQRILQAQGFTNVVDFGAVSRFPGPLRQIP